MPLVAGTRLGVFEILAPLGKGGMGEVYRAKDTKLEREVAVKILPEQMAQRPERMARFEREARLLAALDHPERELRRQQAEAALPERVNHHSAPAAVNAAAPPNTSTNPT